MQAAGPLGLKSLLISWKSAQADCVWLLAPGVGFQPTSMC